MSKSRGKYHHGDLRAALIATGLSLSRAGGPDALRLREVTRLIGVSPNAAYRHFADHQALLAAVAAEIQDRMAHRMSEQTATAEPSDAAARAVGRLRGAGMGYVGFALDEPGWFRLAFFAPEGVERPDGLMPPPLRLLHEALDGLVEAGALAQERRIGAEWSCWATVHGFAELAIHGALRNQPRQRVREFAERAVDEIIAGILGS